MISLSQPWWTQVHGPAQFLERFCCEAAQGGCFFLRHTQPLPWPCQFKTLVYERLQREVGHFRQMEPVDLSGDTSEEQFVERFFPQHTANFLSTTKLSDFLVRTGCLRSCLIWLRIQDQALLQNWLDQMSKFAATSEAKDTIVILEGTSPVPTRRKVKFFDVDQAFSSFDMVQLCTIAANSTPCQEYLKPYLTYLLDQLCGREPSLVDLLADQGEALIRNPAAGAAYLKLDSQTMNLRIRRAQLLLLLPIMEDVRVHSLALLYSQCQTILPFWDDFGNEIKDVYEMELRHIVHFYVEGRLTMTQNQWSDVKNTHDIRNRLMHCMVPLPFSDVEKILYQSNRIG